MTQRLPLLIVVFSFVIALCFHTMALMNMAPIIVTSPILFVTILLNLHFMNTRKQFRGFK
ncbi:hypothetical protein [Priestia koreensis]|uniref:hypothetical protein n=1 Tax=Priestia koreensis TaxID=284581 RepID=UPI001F57E6B3|nr:hypothetical protein [Priestia koreensis]MCM3004875.1 hypothetical protein [Priestia koreensis]UNL85668.1 hypothetical protein IE339_03905 [Priestia koreensis]